MGYLLYVHDDYFHMHSGHVMFMHPTSDTVLYLVDIRAIRREEGKLMCMWISQAFLVYDTTDSRLIHIILS